MHNEALSSQYGSIDGVSQTPSAPLVGANRSLQARLLSLHAASETVKQAMTHLLQNRPEAWTSGSPVASTPVLRLVIPSAFVQCRGFCLHCCRTEHFPLDTKKKKKKKRKKTGRPLLPCGTHISRAHKVVAAALTPRMAGKRPVALACPLSRFTSQRHKRRVEHPAATDNPVAPYCGMRVAFCESARSRREW